MQQTFEQYLASAIMHGTRKHFSALHADFLEQQMSEVSNVNDQKNLNMRSQSIGSPADGKKLANSPEQGSSVTSGMSLSSPVTVGPIKPVDRKTIEGSTPGDHRAPALKADITAFAKNSPGPREPKGQSQVMSSKLPAGSAPENFLGAEGTDRN